MHQDAFELLLAFKSRDHGSMLVAMAKGDLIELACLSHPIGLYLQKPLGVVAVPSRLFDPSTEHNILQEVKMSGVVMHEF